MVAAIRRKKHAQHNGNPMLLNAPKCVSVDARTLWCKGLATFLDIAGRGREGQGCEKLGEWASYDRNRWDFVVTHPQRAHSFANIQYLMAKNKILTKFIKAGIPDYIL